MKTALITGVCLLVLTFTITDALDRKQDECLNSSNDVKACTIAFSNNNAASFCKLNCKTVLTDHYSNCEVGIDEDAANRKHTVLCVVLGPQFLEDIDGDGDSAGSQGNGGSNGGDTGDIGGGENGDGGEGGGNRGSSAGA